MVDAIWCYEKQFKDGQYYPDGPDELYDVEILLIPHADFQKAVNGRRIKVDKDSINKLANEIVEDVKQMGADFILVCPDFRHHKGYDYPHITIGFSDEDQVKKCARKYTGGSYGAPFDGPFKRWCMAKD
jgi:hypothetical protein